VLLTLSGGTWLIVRNLSPSAPQEMLTQVLVPGQTRGDESSGTNKFSIPAGKDTVRLQLELVGNEYQSYRVGLVQSGGAALMQRDLKSQTVNGHAVILFDVPANNLPPGFYQIKLRGISNSGQEENAGSYAFTVIR
jgi:hypothetical protein